MRRGPARGLLHAGVLLLAACGNAGRAVPPTETEDPATVADAPSESRDPTGEPIRITAGASWSEIERIVRASPRGSAVVFTVPDEERRPRHVRAVEPPDAVHVFPVSVRLEDTLDGPRLRYDVGGTSHRPTLGCPGVAPRTRGSFEGWDDAATDALAARLEAVRTWLGGPDDVFRLRIDADRHGETGHPPSVETVERVERRLREACTAIASLDDEGVRDPTHDELSACREAFRWLGGHGNADPPGGWDAEGSLRRCRGAALEPPLQGAGFGTADLQVTALALLAFFGEGYTNRGRHPYAKVVSRGLRRLKDAQGVDGCFGPCHAPTMPLTHALGTLAMFQAYDMTGSPIFRGSTEKALLFVTDALERGRDDPRALGVCAVIVASVRTHVDEQKKRGKTPRITEPDGLARDLREALRAGRGVPAGIELGGRVLLGDSVDESLVEIAGEEPRDPWTDWLLGLGLKRLRGDAWDAWRHAVQPRLREAQRFDGSACCYRGSWDPPLSLTDLGRVGTTALAVRILEVRDEIRYHFHFR